MTRDEALALKLGDEVLVRGRVVEHSPETASAVSVRVEFVFGKFWLPPQRIHSLAPPPPPEPLKAGDVAITSIGAEVKIIAIEGDWAWVKDAIFGACTTVVLSNLTRKATP